MWKRLTWLACLTVLVLVMVMFLVTVSAAAYTKLFYRMSCRSDYRKVDVVITTTEPTVESVAETPTEPPLVEIPLEPTLTPEPTFTPIPTKAPTEVSTPTPCVESMVNMSMADYAGLDDINVTMTGYACGAEDEELSTAWESIKANYEI